MTSRPALHLTPRRGWLNDPLGLTWREGRYDLFFQAVPAATAWAPECSWAHATSVDLVTWAEVGTALAPGDGDDGVWSGSVVRRGAEGGMGGVDGEGAALFYTSVSAGDPDHGRIRVARPADREWGAWRKGPVVAEPPADLALTAYRDPFAFRDGDGWSMLVGAGLGDGSGAVLAYASEGLDSAWSYRGVAASRSGGEREPVWTGNAWECPQLVRFHDADVLLVSVWSREALHSLAYGVGRWAEGRFTARSWGRLGYGDSLYAASVFQDAEGRPGLIAWLREVRGDGWAGALSVPYRLSLEGDRLVARPHPAVAAAAGTLDLAGETAVDRATTARWTPRGTLELLGPDGAGVLRLTAAGGAVTVEPPRAAPVGLPHGGGPVELVLDTGVVEVACDGGILAVPVPGVSRAVAAAG